MSRTPTLTPAAATALHAATAALAAIGLTPSQLCAILRATDIAGELADTDRFSAGATADDFIEANGDLAYDDWIADVEDAAIYLTA